jgi:dipeptidyl aminopeptidase/acylaminoacyl peptidase
VLACAPGRGDGPGNDREEQRLPCLLLANADAGRQSLQVGLPDRRPATRINIASAPTLLIHGTANWLVPLAQSQVFARKLCEAGAYVKPHTIEKAGHGFGSGPGEHDREVHRTALEFRKERFTPRLARKSPG